MIKDLKELVPGDLVLITTSRGLFTYTKTNFGYVTKPIRLNKKEEFSVVGVFVGAESQKFLFFVDEQIIFTWNLSPDYSITLLNRVA